MSYNFLDHSKALQANNSCSQPIQIFSCIQIFSIRACDACSIYNSVDSHMSMTSFMAPIHIFKCSAPCDKGLTRNTVLIFMYTFSLYLQK